MYVYHLNKHKFYHQKITSSAKDVIINLQVGRLPKRASTNTKNEVTTKKGEKTTAQSSMTKHHFSRFIYQISETIFFASNYYVDSPTFLFFLGKKAALSTPLNSLPCRGFAIAWGVSSTPSSRWHRWPIDVGRFWSMLDASNETPWRRFVPRR